MPSQPSTPDRRLVRLDPERLSDCQRLSDARYAETGVEIDPGAIRDALRNLVGRWWPECGAAVGVGTSTPSVYDPDVRRSA